MITNQAPHRFTTESGIVGSAPHCASRPHRCGEIGFRKPESLPLPPELQCVGMKHYRSSIPKSAHERVVATLATGPQKYKVECILDGKVVGIRYFHKTGELQSECPLKNGVTHGVVYRSDRPGKLLSAQPCSNGLPHGIAKQWSDFGELIGRNVMKRGTGVDLWYNQNTEDEPPWLSEARYLKAGKWHGFEWWLNKNQTTVSQERHFWNDQLHGIERSWNRTGRLRRGYPKYWINDRQVTKRQYIRESDKNREKDSRPERHFPREIRVTEAQSSGLYEPG